MKKTVSHSEIDIYLQCKRKHYYQYGLGLYRTQTSDSLARGTFGHSALEQLFNGMLEGKSLDESFGLAYAWISEQITAEFDLMNSSTLQFANQVSKCIKALQTSKYLEGLEVLAVEKRFEVPIYNELEMSLVIDVILRDQEGNVIVADNKFTEKPYQYKNDYTQLLPQLPRYIIALQALNLPVDQVKYHLFNPAKGTFEIETVYVTQPRLTTVKEEFIIVGSNILFLRQQVEHDEIEGLAWWSNEATRVNLSMICNRCPMKALCIAELNDDNPQLVMDTFYKTKEDNGPGSSESTNISNGTET